MTNSCDLRRFILMETEEDAKDTLLDLRLKKRLFRGQPIKGRLKSGQQQYVCP